MRTRVKPASILSLLSIGTLGVSLLFVGGGLGCSVFASKDEYSAYRAVRVAPHDDARLIAMGRYIQNHGTGVWSREIQAERARLEPEIWATRNTTRDGLEFYMAAFPDGPHAAMAQPRLAALQAVAGRRMTEEERQREIEAQRRAADEERRRTWNTRAMQFWMRTLLSVGNWGSPIAQVARQNRDFSRAFGANPQPRCSRDECIKFYQTAYSIPVPGSTRVDRTIDLMLRLRLRGGRLERGEMLLPNKGFSRWYEMENRTLVTDEDPTQRQQAIEWALARIVPIIREISPNAATLDVVPEPIDPPTIRAPNMPDEGASTAPGEEAEPAAVAAVAEPAAAEPAAPAAPAAPDESASVINSLLNQAAGPGATAPAAPQASPTPATPQAQSEPAPETIVIPIAIQGFRVGDLRVVVFAASAEDYGTGYDGVFIERMPGASQPAPGPPAAQAAAAPAPPARPRAAGPAGAPAPAAPAPAP